MRPEDYNARFASAMINAIPDGGMGTEGTPFHGWWNNDELLGDWVGMWSGR
jgi:hypothetical protein